MALGDANVGSSNSLNVDTSQLAAYGNYLISSKETLDSCLDSLNTKMAGITNGWKDEDGEAFKSKFSLFVTKAKKINVEVAALGNYAVKTASKYENVLEKSLELMGD